MKPAHTPDLLSRQLQGDVEDKMATLSLEQLAQWSGVATADLKGLVDHGVLTPITPLSDPWVFRMDCVMTLQRADHLRQDLALDDHGFALAMMLLSHIADLEGELRNTQSKLPTLCAEGQFEGRAN